jgi:glycosyltransferase involved in cell wall biosynthesis
VRVGVISPPWLPVPPPGYGGLEVMVDRLARGLVDAGHDVVLAAPAGSTCPVPHVEALPSPDWGRIGATVVEIPYVLAAYAGLDDVDVIHDHTVAGPVCGRPPAAVPVVTTNHGPFDQHLNEIYREVGDRVAVVAISHHQASTARDVPIARVIHHGIDVAAAPIGTGSGGFACFLGRMSPDKGVREAILVARAAGVPLHIAAKMREPAEEEYFEQAVRPLLDRNVTYLGELGQADKYELLADAVALVNPIRWSEPFGLVMIEALACGTPVIATPRGAASEIVDDGVTGFVRSGLSELASALRDVDRLERGDCRHTAAVRFSTERMVADHVELYCELLSSASQIGRVPTLPSQVVPLPRQSEASQRR